MAMLHHAPGSHVETSPKSFQRALSLIPDARISLPTRNSGLLARRSLPALGINSRQAEQRQKPKDKRSAISEPNYKMTIDSGISLPWTPTFTKSEAVKSVCTEDTFVEPRSAKSLSWPAVCLFTAVLTMCTKTATLQPTSMPVHSERHEATPASAPLASRRGHQMPSYHLPSTPSYYNRSNRTSQEFIFGSDDWSYRRHSRDQTFSTNYTGSTGAPTTPSDEDYHHVLDDGYRKRSLTSNNTPHFPGFGSSAQGQGHYRQHSEFDPVADLQHSVAHLLERGRCSPAELHRASIPAHIKSGQGDMNKAANDSTSNPAGLMGTSAGHFGPAIRDKVSDILDRLLPALPVDPMVTIVEYGCCRSNSVSLIPPILSALNKPENPFAEFNLVHTDSSASDFRPIIQQLESNSSSYLSNSWQASQSPSLHDRVFNAFSARDFGDMVVPRESALVGLSLMDLHWGTGPKVGLPDVKLAKFLHTRAKEFKTGGVLILAYLQREEHAHSSPRMTNHVDLPGFTSPLKVPARPTHHPDSLSTCMMRGRSGSSPVRPHPPVKQYDIWHSLANTLAPCIQRLVSCGMVKSDVARHLLEVSLGFAC